MRTPRAVWLLLLLSRPLPAAEPRCFGPSSDAGSSAAVRVEDVPQAHTAQLLAADPGRVLDDLDAALRGVGSSLERAVKVNWYVTRAGAVPGVDRAMAARFKGPHRPAVSFVVTPLPHPDALVGADAVAVSAAVKRTRSVAVLPAGARVYVSGQAEKGTDLADATRKTIAGLDATLKHLGRTRADVVQAKAFLTPMSGVEAARKELAAAFGGAVLSFVEWESTLPIEIELVVAGGKAGEGVEYLTPPGMTASPIYSRVARVGGGPTVYVGGRYGADGEVAKTFDGLGKVLETTGTDWRHLAKATYYVSTEVVSRELNEVRPKYYDARRPPAAS
ncbi:MAG: RidA family protein, partial [Gemmataceae bacterium]